jgi:hypothetical protein
MVYLFELLQFLRCTCARAERNHTCVCAASVCARLSVSMHSAMCIHFVGAACREVDLHQHEGARNAHHWQHATTVSPERKRGDAMSTFVMVTRIDPAALRTPQSLEILERHVSESIRLQCPKVK